MTKKDLTDLRCGDGIFSTPKSDPMYPACSTHDVDYIEGGTEEQHKEADDNLRKNCEFEAAKKEAEFERIEEESDKLNPRLVRAAFLSALCWFESKVYPAIVSAVSDGIWKPYSRLAEYLKQGKEKEEKNDE